jgi:hypothetical protein
MFRKAKFDENDYNNLTFESGKLMAVRSFDVNYGGNHQ